jgi:hypothetical protein
LNKNDIYNILPDSGFPRSDYDKSHKKERQVVTIEIVDNLVRLLEKRKLVTHFDTHNRFILGK